MKKSQIANFAFVGCMMAGIGIGMLLGNAGAGTLIGMGVGFAFKAIVHLSDSETKELQDQSNDNL